MAPLKGGREKLQTPANAGSLQIEGGGAGWS